jgi:hypothetical protein
MSIQQDTHSAGGSGEILDETNYDAEDNAFSNVNENRQKRGKGKIYELLHIYTSIDLAKQEIQEGIVDGKWSIKAQTPDANGYSVGTPVKATKTAQRN